MKRLLSMLLVVVMVMSLAMTAVYAEEETEVTLPFTDVKDGKWFTDAVKYVYANGLMNGKEPTKFAPNEVLTRAQFAKMLWSLAGKPATEADLKFADTKNTQWYAESLTWAVNSGIVNGYEEGGKSLFKPNKNIARDELAKMIVTFLQFMEVEIVGEDIADPFPDKIQNWAKEFVEAVRLSGLMKGKEGGAFAPKANATRAEGATIIMRMHPSLTMTPTKVMEKMVDDFLAEALCSVHSQVEIYYNKGASVTAENTVNAFATAMNLDTTLYTLELTAGLDGFKDAYSGAGRGTSAPGDLSFKLTDIASGEFVEFDARIYGTKFYDVGANDEDDTVTFYSANPPFIPFMCPDEFSTIKEAQALAANMDALKNAGAIRVENVLKFDYAGIWNAINDIIAPDHNKFELILKKSELDAVIAQTPAKGVADITADLTVEIRALCKGVAVVTETIPVTFKVGYEDLTPGIADITVDALEVLPGSVKIDGQISDGEYTMVDTFIEELELRNKANGSSAVDAVLLDVAKSAKLGFAWDQAKGLHIAAQWVDPCLGQTYSSENDWTSNGHGDNVCFSGTSFQLTVQTDKAINSATPLYYALGKNTETGDYYAGTYSGQGGYGDALYNNPPVPEQDYIITYGEGNLVTVEWTIPANVISEDGIFEADDALYMSAVMMGKHDDGFFGVSWGNDGVFKANGTPGTPGSNMTINLKGTGVCDAITGPMQEAIDAFLDSTECVHGDYNFMFTYGGSMTVESTLYAVAQAVGGTDKYTVELDGDTNTSGWQAARDSYGNCDWAGGGGAPIKFILVDNATGLKLPFEFKFVGQKHFSLIDYKANGSDFNDTTWDDEWTNKGEGYTDGIGVGASPIYAPWYCSDLYGTIPTNKLNDEIFAQLDQYKAEDGYVEIPVSNFADITAQTGTAYGYVWHAINDLLDYEYPKYYFALTADDVNALIRNGGEGTLKVKITPSSGWVPLTKGDWREINFRFIDKTAIEMQEAIDAFLDSTECVHGDYNFLFTYGGSMTVESTLKAVTAAIGNEKYTVTLDGSEEESGYTAMNNEYLLGDWLGGGGGVVKFILNDIATGTKVPFEFKMIGKKNFSLIDYQANGLEDFHNTDWDNAGANNAEGYTDALGVGADAVYAPWGCNDLYGTINTNKYTDEKLAQLDEYKDDNGTVVIPVADLASITAQVGTSYGNVWHAINDLLKYDHPEYYMVLTADAVHDLIVNGGEGTLKIKLTPSNGYKGLEKGDFREINFKFVQAEAEA